MHKSFSFTIEGVIFSAQEFFSFKKTVMIDYKIGSYPLNTFSYPENGVFMPQSMVHIIIFLTLGQCNAD